MRRKHLDGVFASLLLAACGGSPPAPQTGNGAPAATLSEKPAEKPAQAAPLQAEPSPAQRETSTPPSNRPQVAPSTPAVNVPVPEGASPLPDENSVPQVYRVMFTSQGWRMYVSADPEITRALVSLPPDLKSPPEGLYIWKANGTVRHGSLADALFPLDTPGKVLAYLRAKGHTPSIDAASRAWFIKDKGGEYEVVVRPVDEEGQGPCPHSDRRSTTRLLSISRQGVIQEHPSRPSGAFTGPMPCIGRDTEGSARSLRAPVSPVSRAAYFAQLARDEATSVGSFRRLAAELSQAGAPCELSARARAAAEDEVRHAAAMRRLARAAGATEAELLAAQVPEVTYPVRDLEAVLLENAREGCIHETYAALVAAYQARYAEDPEVREVLATIAAEEQRHAELAWDLHAWASERDPRMAARLREALEGALVNLAALVEARLPRPWDAAVGEPAPARAHALVEALGEALAPLAAA